MSDKNIAKFQLKEKLSETQRGDICRDLEYHGSASVNNYRCSYSGNLVEITDTESNTTIAVPFDKFEYTFLCNRVTKGVII